MALPASGQISLADINVELGRSSNAQIDMDGAENGSIVTINVNSASRPSADNPASITEWYSYNHSAAPPCYSYNIYNPDQNYDVYVYYTDCTTGAPLQENLGPERSLDVCSRTSPSAAGGNITFLGSC